MLYLVSLVLLCFYILIGQYVSNNWKTLNDNVCGHFTGVALFISVLSGFLFIIMRVLAYFC